MIDVMTENGTVPWKVIGTEACMLGWMRGVASPLRLMSPMAEMRRRATSTSTRSTSMLTKQAISQSISTEKETHEQSFADPYGVWMISLSSLPLSLRCHLRRMSSCQLSCRCLSH